MPEAVESPAPVSTTTSRAWRHASASARAVLIQLRARPAATPDEGPEETAHEEREVAHVAMEGARAGRPGRGRAEPQHLDDAFEPRATGRAQVVEAVRAREFRHYLGKVGGDGVVADAELRAGAAREREEEAQQRAIPEHALRHRLSPDPRRRTHASCPPPSQTIVAPHPPRSGGASAKRSTSGLADRTSWTRRRCTPRPRPWISRTSWKPASRAASR